MVDFHPLINNKLPRILTQMSRDPNTTHYGSFDRNWWHYKIRDFSSIILQQGGYFLDLTSRLSEYQEFSGQLREYSRASVRFWADRALRKGAFEEYYPWEDGYPPLAFSTLAVAKIILCQKPDTTPYLPALKKAAGKLLHRFEREAANQQIAGLAALAALRKVDPSLVDNTLFEKLTDQTLSLQSKEGWFTEYDGPDLGYLSVSLDCLWDLCDLTEDQRFFTSAAKAFRFLAELVMHNHGSIGMHNSRNTDYIVPYGICRFLRSENQEETALADLIVRMLYEDTGHQNHFFQAVDDRYWCHYIGHSVVRAQIILDGYDFKTPEARIPVIPDKLYPDSGYVTVSKGNHRIITSCRKGGIISVRNGQHFFNDFGWIVSDGKKQSVTHWWTPGTRFSGTTERLQVTGHPVGVRENLSNPWKHLMLRAVSYFLGNRVISLLKKLLIFRKGDQGIVFNRNIEIGDGQLVIHDEFSGLVGSETIIKAPRFSKRHVASADSFHQEDLSVVKGYTSDTVSHWEGNHFIAITTVHLA